MALAGHVSKSMLARYSHIRQAAKQAAIEALEAERTIAKFADSENDSPQNPPQSVVDELDRDFIAPENSLN